MNRERGRATPIASAVLMSRVSRTLLAGVILALLLASPAAAAGKLVAHLSATTHTPKAGAPWPIHIMLRDDKGHDVRGTVRYAYLYQGEVVLRQDPKGKNSFVGDFRDHHLTWPKRSIGLELTFRAVVDTKLGQANLDYMVKVHR
jgi:hypothetical protein